MTEHADRAADGRFLPGNVNPAAAEPGNTRALKYDEEIVERILTAIRAGAVLETAAAYAGIARSTYHKWMQWGRAGKEPFATFEAEVQQALADAEMTDLAFIANARGKEWTAAAWRLERRYPERYGRRTRIDGNVTVTAQPFIDTRKLSADELEQLTALLEKARPDPADPALGTDGRAAADLLEAADGEWEEVDEQRQISV